MMVDLVDLVVVVEIMVLVAEQEHLDKVMLVVMHHQ
jgi:hypothetical protein